MVAAAATAVAPLTTITPHQATRGTVTLVADMEVDPREVRLTTTAARAVEVEEAMVAALPITTAPAVVMAAAPQAVPQAVDLDREVVAVVVPQAVAPDSRLTRRWTSRTKRGTRTPWIKSRAT